MPGPTRKVAVLLIPCDSGEAGKGDEERVEVEKGVTKKMHATR